MAAAPDNVEPEASARSTLALLETRLRRLEFLLTGIADLDGKPELLKKSVKRDESVSDKLKKLEADLERLRRLDGAGGTLVRDVDALRTPSQL